MSKKTTSKNQKLGETKFEIFENTFYSEIKDIIAQARKRIYRNIDFELVMANWKIGKMLDEKQNSFPRAEYGKKLIEELSIQMTKDFGSGYSERNLRE